MGLREVSGTASQKAENGRFRRIVAATDGSEDAQRATRVAIDLAKREGAELLIVSAVAWATGVNGSSADVVGGVRALTEYHDYARTEAKEVLRKATALAKASGVEAEGVLLDRATSAVQMITEFAKKEGADLIVVGTRGLSGFKKLLPGSVSSGIATHAPCSVLVVR